MKLFKMIMDIRRANLCKFPCHFPFHHGFARFDTHYNVLDPLDLKRCAMDGKVVEGECLIRSTERWIGDLIRLYTGFGDNRALDE